MHRCVCLTCMTTVCVKGMALEFACVFLSTCVFVPLHICMYLCLGCFPESVLVCRVLFVCLRLGFHDADLEILTLLPLAPKC